MRHSHVDTLARSSSVRDTDRIRLLLKEIWDVRKSEDPEQEPALPKLWGELEHLVSQELEHKVTEELAVQD